MSLASAEGDSSSRRTKVVYVVGAGRSGSTILGVALGNCADVFFAGELDKWLSRSGEPKLKDAARVTFWSDVRARVVEPDALFDGRVHRYIERSSALFRRRRRSIRRGLLAPYRRITGELYAAVAASAGTSYVVDTSHYPLRARELQAVEGIELYLLLLVRDPRDVVASFAKDDVVERQFNPVTTRAYLLLTYVLSSWVFLRHPRERRLLIRYEDLIEDPQGTLRELLDRLGSAAAVPDLEALATGTPLHGNRLLANDVVSLKRRRAEPSADRLAGRLFARLLLGAIGRLRPRVTPRSARAGSRLRSRDGAQVR
ncbi:MAG TPA: sulfotransferase [Solirubrobacteraceae bacterium]|jgi:hypothetical protein|nr:sulfotransferase [Solirubrobacteraceae bacterium]